jgi:hypothetical protein
MADIQHKRATAAQWTATNPILADGEMGIETDTLQFKFGDGIKTWTQLSYAAAGSGGNLDGGTPESIYGGTTAIDGGGI